MAVMQWSTTSNESFDTQEITLQKILQQGPGGGGGGGIGAVYRTTGNPNGSIIATVNGAISYDPATGNVWLFTGTAPSSSNWVEVIGP